MSHFKNYAAYYDLVYQDKDYPLESKYVFELIKKYGSKNIKTLLNIGSGTGKHDFCLKKLMPQTAITGIDLSQEMVKIAEANNHFKDIKFLAKDSRNFNLNKKYDVVTSLFHVISYQTQNSDLDKTFLNVNKHLEKGGLFIFDVWYGPAVLGQKPEKRIKHIENDKFWVERKAAPLHLEQENIVIVNYDISIKDKNTTKTYSIKEKHPMRYFFVPEMAYVLEKNGFQLLKTEESFTKKPATEKTWSACFICKKIKNL
jgi:SAM-dependent methyltransferase